MKTLIAKLTEADISYYKNDAPIMTDRDYDLLYPFPRLLVRSRNNLPRTRGRG